MQRPVLKPETLVISHYESKCYNAHVLLRQQRPASTAAEQRTTIRQQVHGAVTRRQHHLSATSTTRTTTLIRTTPTTTPIIITVPLVTQVGVLTQGLQRHKPPLRTLPTPLHPPPWYFTLIFTQLSTRTKFTYTFTAVHPQATCTGIRNQDRHWGTHYSVTTTRMMTQRP